MQAVLTIDDAPNNHFDTKLSYLTTHNIPSVVFCEGRKITAQKDLLIEAVNNGIVLGNHSFSHTVASELSVDEFVDEVCETDELLQQVYDEAGVDWGEKYFRFPWGDRGDTEEKKKELQGVLDEMGYVGVDIDKVPDSYSGTGFLRDWNWSFNVKEHRLPENESASNRVLQHPYSLNKTEIVLLHDSSDQDKLFVSLMLLFNSMAIDFVHPSTITR